MRAIELNDNVLKDRITVFLVRRSDRYDDGMTRASSFVKTLILFVKFVDQRLPSARTQTVCMPEYSRPTRRGDLSERGV